MAPSQYTQGHTQSIVDTHLSRNAANSCKFFVHLLESHNTFLDAGCGPGSVTSSVAQLVPQGRAIGVDASTTVIHIARAQKDLPSNVSFAVADIQNLPFPDETFDVVFTSQALIHSSNPCDALRELRRVCKQGGFVACREGSIAATMFHPPHPGLLRWREVLEAILRGAQADPTAATSLMRWAIDAGFASDKLSYSLGSITYTGEERKWYGVTTAARMMEDKEWREKGIKLGVASEEDFAAMREGYLALSADEAGLYSMACGQLIGHK